MTRPSAPEQPTTTSGIESRMASTNTATPFLLTIEEAAERLRIGRTSMYHLVATGAVETVTVGRLRRVPVECLTEYVNRLRSGLKSNSPAA
jgi:excisionase family DNA binding protein